LVQDFEVTREQLSTRRYKGTYTFRFRPAPTKARLASYGKVVSDERKAAILVLPLYQAGEKYDLWSEVNPWMRAWRSLPPHTNEIQPVILPLGDAQDMAQLGAQQGMDFDPLQIQQLAARYKAEDAVLAVASVESATPTQVALTINLYKNSFEGPAFFKKMNAAQKPGEATEAFFARAAQEVREALRSGGLRKTQHVQAVPVQSTTTPAPIPYTRPALGPLSTYAVTARFGSVQDWVRMKNTLDRLYGMQSVMIKSLKPREAQLELRFSGNINALSAAFGGAGITFKAGNAGGIEIHMGPHSRPIYR
jgi:hypothetical protein